MIGGESQEWDNWSDGSACCSMAHRGIARTCVMSFPHTTESYAEAPNGPDLLYYLVDQQGVSITSIAISRVVYLVSIQDDADDGGYK